MSLHRRKLAAGSPWEISYDILRGAMPGPICVVTAGMHGTERAGIRAAHQLLKAKVHRGTLIIIPIVNVKAYRRNERGRPDFNRTFPRKQGDSARHIVTRELFHIVQQARPALCIDLHEAMGFSRVQARALGQSLICYPRREIRKLALRTTETVNQRIKSPHRRFTVKRTILPGSFRTAVTHVLNIPAITVETSMNQSLQTRTSQQLDIVLSLLKEVGCVVSLRS